MTHRQWRKRWHGLAVILLLVLLALLISSAAFKNRIDETAAWTIQFTQEYPFQGAVVFVLFSAISAMLAFASSAVLVPAATAVWGKLGAFVLLLGGWTLGAAAAYGIGRLATPLLIRLGYGKKLVKYQRFVSRGIGFWGVFLFCVAVPSEVPGYLFGSAHYRFLKFITAMALAESLYACGVVVIGERLAAVKPSLVLIVIGIAIVIIGSLAMTFRSGRGRSLKS